MNPTFFNSAADFGAWLEKHHASESALLVGFHKKNLGRGITYLEALDQALCFGWIDGVRRRIDAESYSIRFTPRQPGSIWSAVNLKRAKQLESQGKMSAAGLRAFRGRDEQKTRKYSYERAEAKLSPSLNRILRTSKAAAAFFDTQPPGYRKIATFWIMSGKKEETRERRLAHLIERSAKGKRIDLLSPNRK